MNLTIRFEYSREIACVIVSCYSYVTYLNLPILLNVNSIFLILNTDF